jgi:6-phospho-3-hexuloisomerase
MGGEVMNYEEYRTLVVKELNEVLKRIKENDLQQALEAIKDANKVVAYAGGREGLALKSFTMRLMHLGKDAHWAWDDTAPAVGKGDLCIFAGGTGVVGHVYYTADEVHRRGSKILVVTASPKSKLASYADTLVYLPGFTPNATGDVVQSGQLMGNLFEQSLLLLCDIMVMMLRDQLGISSEIMTSRHRNYE